MQMVGIYHIALLTEADEDAFVSHIASNTFGESGVLQLTRVTSGFDFQVLRRSVVAGAIRKYAWRVMVRCSVADTTSSRTSSDCRPRSPGSASSLGWTRSRCSRGAARQPDRPRDGASRLVQNATRSCCLPG